MQTDNKNGYYSIEEQHTTTLKIKRSTFICTLSPAASLPEAKAFISQVSKENKKATHNCWAYILGDKGEVRHSSDAGEPSGTAGKPMLNMLRKNRMTWVAAVVTRYFGGVKLGVKGLIDAYGDSVQTAVEEIRLEKVVRTVRFFIEIAYDYNDVFMRRIKNCLVRISDTAYSEKIVYTLEIKESQQEEALRIMKECSQMGKMKFSVVK